MSQDMHTDSARTVRRPRATGSAPGVHAPPPGGGSAHADTDLPIRERPFVVPGDRPGAPETETSARVARVRGAARFGIRPFLLASDVLAIAVSVTVMHVVGVRPDQASPTVRIVIFGVVLIAVLWAGGLYRSRLSLSVLDDLPALASRSLAAAALCALGGVAWAAVTTTTYDVTWLYLAGAVTIGIFTVLFRAIGYAVVRRARSHGVIAHRALILGAGQVGNQLAEVLRSHPEYGLQPIGFLDADPPPIDRPQQLPVLGGPESLARVLLQNRVRTVVVAFSSMKESDMVSLIRTCDRLSCELFVVPRLFELHQVESSMDTAWGFPLVRLRRATYRSRAWRVKRVVDVLFSGLALALMAPVLLLLALAVRLDGGGDILFRQERVGVDGYHFQLLKFRSLRPATEAESATKWSVVADPRLTKVGRFLRATSLDELPQLINILRGDMSLVGPRPERPHFVSQFQSLYPSYEARHRVPSGLTGWAQVHGLRGDTSIADRARFDNYYIENWSLWLDVKIMLRTVSSVLRGAGG